MGLAVLVARGPRDLRRDGTAYSAGTQVLGVSVAASGPLVPDLDPGLNERPVHPGGEAQFNDLPVPGGLALVLAVAEGQACALGQQVRPPGRGLPQLGDRGGFRVGGEPSAGSGMCRKSGGLCHAEIKDWAAVQSQ